MSNHLISTTYKRVLKTPMRKAVMVLLADKASDDGEGIFASKKTMADELDCSRQAVIDTIKSLCSDGLLVEVGQKPNANGYTVEYRIVVEALEALPLHAAEARKQTRQAAGRVKEVDATRQGAGHKPLLNPPTSSGAKAPSDGGGDYAFSGRVIRLTAADLDRWQSTYHTIPDLKAELLSIDGWLLDNGHRGKWFHKVQGMLNRKHQENLKPKAAEDPYAYRREPIRG